MAAKSTAKKPSIVKVGSARRLEIRMKSCPLCSISGGKMAAMSTPRKLRITVYSRIIARGRGTFLLWRPVMIGFMAEAKIKAKKNRRRRFFKRKASATKAKRKRIRKKLDIIVEESLEFIPQYYTITSSCTPL